MKQYDLIIIGAGPAGLTAGIYAGRYTLDTLIVGKKKGGLMNEIPHIENYSGWPEVSGENLTQNMVQQVQKAEASLKIEEVVTITRQQKQFVVETKQGQYSAKVLLIASGMHRRTLNLENEDKFRGQGLSYCATCDAPFFKNETVAVVGGGNAGVSSALYLSEIAKKVYLITHGEALRCFPYREKNIKQAENVEIIYHTEVTQLKGKNSLQAIQIQDAQNKQKELPVAGLFVEIGSDPAPINIQQVELERDKNNLIKVNEKQETSHSQIWAAGSVTNNSRFFDQIITACAEGAIAAKSIYQNLQKNKRSS